MIPTRTKSFHIGNIANILYVYKGDFCLYPAETGLVAYTHAVLGASQVGTARTRAIVKTFDGSS
jgi:hypothetical protein